MSRRAIVASVRDDDAFCHYVVGRLAGLPGVQAVALGGSRAVGTNRPDSDWDFAVYYRGAFSPDDLRAVGWPGTVFEIGGWGGGVFNGGAGLQVDGPKVDVPHRDLEGVEYRLREARAGRFGIERLQFHLAGVPTYIVLAEVAGNRLLAGELPAELTPPRSPDALRPAASRGGPRRRVAGGAAARRRSTTDGVPTRSTAGSPRPRARSRWPRVRPRTPQRQRPGSG